MSQYIKKEDVQKLRNKVINRWWPNDTDMTRLAELSLFAEINSLPSINPEAMIEEMIEEINKWWVSYIEQPITILKEAKYRIQKQS